MDDQGSSPSTQKSQSALDQTQESRETFLLKKHFTGVLFPIGTHTHWNRILKNARYNGDTIFVLDDETQHRVFGSVFSIVAAAQGRPAIPLNHFGTIRETPSGSEPSSLTIVYIDVPKERRKSVLEICERCIPEDMTYLRTQLQLHSQNTNGNAAEPNFFLTVIDDTALDVGASKSTPTKGKIISVPNKKEAQSKNASNITSKLVPKQTTKLLSPQPPGRLRTPQPKLMTSIRSQTTSTKEDYNDYSSIRIPVHRFLLPLHFPYYRYLWFAGELRGFADSESSISKLPSSVFNEVSLRLLSKYIYNPRFILDDLFDVDVWRYACCVTCDWHESSGGVSKLPNNVLYQKATKMIADLLDFARAAQYLGETSIPPYSERCITYILHGLEASPGKHCANIAPSVLQEMFREENSDLLPEFRQMMLDWIARCPDRLWKRPLILCDDIVLQELVQSAKAHHSSGERENWAFYISLKRLHRAVHASSTTSLCERWDQKLLAPLLESCMHQFARNFDSQFLYENILTLAGANFDRDGNLQIALDSVSFDRSIALDLLTSVTTMSPRQAELPFEQPILTYKTIVPIFTGLSKMADRLGIFSEHRDAEKRVVSFLRREWLSMSVGGQNGTSLFKPQKTGLGFTNAQIVQISQRLRVSVDELLGSPSLKVIRGWTNENEQAQRAEKLRATERGKKRAASNNIVLEPHYTARTEKQPQTSFVRHEPLRRRQEQTTIALENMQLSTMELSQDDSTHVDVGQSQPVSSLRPEASPFNPHNGGNTDQTHFPN